MVIEVRFKNHCPQLKNYPATAYDQRRYTLTTLVGLPVGILHKA